MATTEQKQQQGNANPAQGAVRLQRLGEPGKEIEIRRHLTVSQPMESDENPRGDVPLKGGPKTEGTSVGRMRDEMTEEGEGRQSVYVFRRRDSEQAEVPVIQAGDNGEEALLVFSIREKVKLFLQAAKMDQDYEPASLSPTELGTLLRDAKKQGVAYVAVDAHRQAQYQGDPQPVLHLRDTGDRTDAAFYSEIQAMRRG